MCLLIWGLINGVCWSFVCAALWSHKVVFKCAREILFFLKKYFFNLIWRVRRRKHMPPPPPPVLLDSVCVSVFFQSCSFVRSSSSHYGVSSCHWAATQSLGPLNKTKNKRQAPAGSCKIIRLRHFQRNSACYRNWRLIFVGQKATTEWIDCRGVFFHADSRFLFNLISRF